MNAMKTKKQTTKKSRLAKQNAHPDRLKGWTKIAQFLGQPVAVAQRWARSGMPVQREGRLMTASPEELSRFLGREAGLDVPVHIASEGHGFICRSKACALIRASGSQEEKAAQEMSCRPIIMRSYLPRFVPGVSVCDFSFSSPGSRLFSFGHC